MDDSSVSPGTDSDSDWPVADFDRPATVYAPDAAAPRSDPSERFRVELDGTPTNRPTVATGTVFQPTMTGIEAFAVDSGEKRWVFRDREEDGAAVFYPPPALHNDRAYIGTERGVVAVDTETGDEQWRVETESRVTAPPVPDLDWRYLFVGTNTAEVLRIALDGTTEAEPGEVDWRTSAYGAITRMTSGHGLPSSVLVGTAGGEVHSLYDGRGLWRTKVPGKVTALTAQQGTTSTWRRSAAVYFTSGRRLTPGASHGVQRMARWLRGHSSRRVVRSLAPTVRGSRNSI